MNELIRAQHRRSYRTATSGAAVVQVAGAVVHVHSVNLSLGGLLVEWRAAVAGRPPVGAPVWVQLDIGGSGWLRQRGHVQRCDRGLLAIGFDALSPDTEDQIEDRVLAWLEAERSPRLLIVDPWPARRHRIAAEMVHAGYCSIEASTPLAALQQLEQPQLHIAAVAVAETATQTGRADLIAYLAEAHAGLPLVLIGARAHDAVAELLARMARPLPP
jgi:hypothetical protein